MSAHTLVHSRVHMALCSCADTLHEWQGIAESIRQHMQDRHQGWRATFTEMREQLRQAKVTEQLREAVGQLPREVKSHHFARHFLNRLDAFELECARVAEGAAAESYAARWAQMVANFRMELERFESDPVMQKFLRGERVLSCRTQIQWARKIGHALFGTFAVYLVVYSGLPPVPVWIGIGLFVMAAVALETTRHFHAGVNRWVSKWFRPVMREAEKTRINSAMFYILSLLLVYVFTPLPVAVTCTLFLAWGDPVAGIIGSHYGRTQLAPHVSLEGFLACMVTCMLVAAFVMHTLILAPFGLTLAVASICCGFAGALAEAAFKVVDDNLTLPLLSAPLVWGIFKLFMVI